jgi:hypothetical protein
VLLVAHDRLPEDRQPGEPEIDEALVAALDKQNRAGVAPPTSGVVEARIRQVW